MGLLQNIFSKKELPLTSYEDFWNWFLKNEKQFFRVIKDNKKVEEDFAERFFPKLRELNKGFFYLVGMYDENTAELIFSAEGIIRNIVFVEEFVDAAPKIDGWIITKLKPEIGIDNANISMGGYKFNKDNIRFYSNENSTFPDEIDITIVYDDYGDEHKNTIISGVCIFLDNFLGELNFATKIDNLKIVGKDKSPGGLIPINKLNDFLNWRQKEFVEKYDGIRHNTEHDAYSVLEAKLESGNPLVGVFNRELLNWGSKASHPWILNVEIKYGNDKANNGLPDKKGVALLSEIEDELSKELKDVEGYLNVGRQTANGVRVIYFACRDFRKPSKISHFVVNKYRGRVEVTYDIYKDKYWRSFNRFIPQV